MNFKIPKIPKIVLFGIDIVKNMAFFILFIVIFLSLLGIVVAPTIKRFKTSKNDYFQTYYKLKKSEEKLKEKEWSYKKLFKKNRKIIVAFDKKFETEKFKQFASKYIKIEKIKKRETSPFKDSFIKSDYVVKGYINTPSNFYKFIDSIKNYKAVVTISYPISFKSYQEGQKIELQFKLEHLKSAKLPKK
jgi:hypothetical protein